MLGCSRSDTLPADVTGALEQAITRHDLAATVALFADDAEILPQHGPAIRGREEIEAYFQDSITPKVAYDTDTEMTLVRGDLAVEQGRYRVRNVRRGSDVEEGKYLHVWRRVATTGSCTGSSTTQTSNLAPRSRSSPRARKVRRSAMSTRLFSRFREVEPAGEAAAGGMKSPRERSMSNGCGSAPASAARRAIDSMDAVYRAELRELRSAEIQACALVDEIWVTLLNGPLGERVSQYVATLRRRRRSRARRQQRSHRNPVMRALVHEASRIAENCSTNVRDVVLVAALQQMVHYLIASYGTIAAHAKALGLMEQAALFHGHAESDRQFDLDLSSLAKIEVNPQALTRSDNDRRHDQLTIVGIAPAEQRARNVPAVADGQHVVEPSGCTWITVRLACATDIPSHARGSTFSAFTTR